MSIFDHIENPQEELYIAAVIGTHPLYDGHDWDQATAILRRFWRLAHAPDFRSLLEAAGQTQASASRTLGIPLHTIQNWCLGVREPPRYTVNLIAYALATISTAV